MASTMIKVYDKPSFLRKQIYKLSVNNALRQCESMKENLRKRKKLSREDSFVYVAFLDVSNSKFNGLLFTKGYHRDGSLKPVEIFDVEKGKIITVNEEQRVSIAALDMYENTIFLHNYSADEEYIEGYLINESKYDNVPQVIFTEERVKIYKKNVNNYEEVNTVKEYLSRYVL